MLNALEDMGQFPLVIYAGATGNVLATLTATWFLYHHTDDFRVLWLWAVGIITLNLSPVVFLRLVLKNTQDTPPIREMNFFSGSTPLCLVGLRGGFRQSLFLDRDRMVRVQCERRAPLSAGTSRNSSGGHVLPGLAAVVTEKLNSVGTGTSHRTAPKAQTP